jgi:hypothetical protein
MKVAVSIAALLLVSAATAAIEPPSTLGVARLGSLTVTSSALVSAESAELMGVWNDPKASCNANRRLRIRVAVDFIPASGMPRRVARSGIFKSANCAEGGPNVGFTLTARMLGFACPNGTWKPARYNFVTHTTEPKRGLRATASLNWLNPKRRC